MFEKITEIIGDKKGPTSIILAGVHGNEKCGVEALDKILPKLEIQSGRVLFGYGNPRAIEANKRFTETNLNRMFKDDNLLSKRDREGYEYKRAQFLKSYLNVADALLDIHASSNTNSRPFIICEANSKMLTDYLPVDTIVYGFDNIEPGGTDYYMNSINKIGICVECGYLGDPKSTLIAEENIFAFLKAQGHITNDLQPQKHSYIQMYDLYLTKTNSFSLEKQFDVFEEVIEGEIIGLDGTEEIRAKKNSIILFAQNLTKIGEEAFLLGERINNDLD